MTEEQTHKDEMVKQTFLGLSQSVIWEKLMEEKFTVADIAHILDIDEYFRKEEEIPHVADSNQNRPVKYYADNEPGGFTYGNNQFLVYDNAEDMPIDALKQPYIDRILDYVKHEGYILQPSNKFSRLPFDSLDGPLYKEYGTCEVEIHEDGLLYGGAELSFNYPSFAECIDGGGQDSCYAIAALDLQTLKDIADCFEKGKYRKL